MQPLQVVTFIVVTVVVVFGAYYVTYYIGSKASGQSRGRMKNRNINLLDRFAISKDKSFCLVEIAGKIYVIGVTNQSMTLFDTLDAAEFAQTAAERPDTAFWTAAPGGQLGGRIANRILCFLTGKMWKPGGNGSNASAAGGTFADSMKAASEKKATKQPDRAQAEQLDDTEVDK